jgi:transposase
MPRKNNSEREQFWRRHLDQQRASGLSVRDFLGHEDPFAGHLFVFRSKRGDRLEVLWWDRDGLAIFYKRLESGCFTLPAAVAGARQLELTTADLQLVLLGIDPAKVQRSKRYSRPPAAAM